MNIGEVTYKDSSKAKGYIISTDPEAGTKIDAGSTVNLVVSSGQQSLDITVTLPVDMKTRTYRLYVNNELVKETSVLCNGSNYTSTISGSEDGQSVEVMLDDTTIYTGTANFGSDPAKMSNVSRKSYTMQNLF